MLIFIVLLLCCFALPISAQTLKIHTNEKGLCGYVDLQQNIVIPCKYEMAFPFHNGVGKVGKGDKFGLVDASGKEILPIKYDEIELWGNDIFRIKSGNTYGLISNTGTMIVKPNYSFISHLNCYGKALIALGGKEKKGIISDAKRGIVNADGKIIIEPIYTALYEFNATNEYPRQDTKNTISLLDTMKTDCEYVSCFVNKKNIIIDGQGEAITPLTDKATYAKPSSGMCAFNIQEGRKNTSGYWDITAKKAILISNKIFINHTCHSFTGNIAKIDNPVTRTSYFIDKSGKKISDEYTKAKYKAGYWIVYDKEKKCALLNDKGQFVFEAGRFEDILFPDAGKSATIPLYPVKQGDKWGLVNMQGNVVLPFDYDKLESPRNGRLIATRAGRQGFIKTDGELIVPFDFRSVQIGKSDTTHVWVCKDDSLFYDFDTAQRRIIGSGMRVVTDFHNGLAWVVPQNLQLPDNSIQTALCELYDIKVKSKIPTSFGFLVNDEGRIQTHIPVPQGMFPIMAKALADNGGNLTEEIEKRLLLTHTRSARKYDMSVTINKEDWDY